MTEPHLSEERLISLADEPGSDVEIDAHVLSCADCSETLNFYSTLNVEMRDRESWLIEEEYRTRRGGRPIRDFAARIESEDAAGPALVDHLRELLARDPDADIAADPRFRTGGVVRALEQLVLEQRLIDPFLSERLARVNCALAEALPDDYYPANAVFDLRGRAWVLQAGAYTNLNRYEEAFQAADRAEQAYEQLSDSGTGLPSVKLTRAILYARLQRYSEGLPLANSAADEYERRGETFRYAGAILTAAVIHYRSGENAAALKMYLEVLQIADELQDAELRATTLHNIGLLYRKIGDLDRAGKYLLDALHIMEGFGMKTHLASCRSSIGLLALARAEFADAEKVLRGAISAFRELGAEEMVADTNLDLAESLLMLGRPQEIEALCAESEAYYASIGVLAGRLAAARFLRNAAANQMLRREDIQHVRTYLDESRETPDTPFAPPRRNGPGSGH